MEISSPFSTKGVYNKCPSQVDNMVIHIIDTIPVVTTYRDGMQGYVTRDYDNNLLITDYSGNPQHRNIIHEYLYGVCEATYPSLGFILSSVLVRGTDLLPSDKFTEFLIEVGIINKNQNIEYFWRKQQKLAMEFIQKQHH